MTQNDIFPYTLKTTGEKEKGKMKEVRYKLAAGSQVREEDFGLLFYTMAGPRLYFVSSGDLIAGDFFEGAMTLDQHMARRFGTDSVPEKRIQEIKKGLKRLMDKGVIHEC